VLLARIAARERTPANRTRLIQWYVFQPTPCRLEALEVLCPLCGAWTERYADVDVMIGAAGYCLCEECLTECGTAHYTICTEARPIGG
jgi:hypothetical protein